MALVALGGLAVLGALPRFGWLRGDFGGFKVISVGFQRDLVRL